MRLLAIQKSPITQREIDSWGYITKKRAYQFVSLQTAYNLIVSSGNYDRKLNSSDIIVKSIEESQQTKWSVYLTLFLMFWWINLNNFPLNYVILRIFVNDGKNIADKYTQMGKFHLNVFICSIPTIVFICFVIRIVIIIISDYLFGQHKCYIILHYPPLQHLNVIDDDKH